LRTIRERFGRVDESTQLLLSCSVACFRRSLDLGVAGQAGPYEQSHLLLELVRLHSHVFLEGSVALLGLGEALGELGVVGTERERRLVLGGDSRSEASRSGQRGL
jgi:hypothetical protein